MKKAIVILSVLFLSVTSYGFIELNDIVPVFSEEDQGAIEGAVIRGAVHFLQAQSHAALLLAEYEKSGQQSFDFSAALSYAEKAAAEVEKSINEYHQAITVGKQAGYVNEMIQKCKNFNYDAFNRENKLNSDITTVVKAYFSEGNILGIYQQNVAYLGEILITLEFIKEKLSAGQVPGISLFWQLVQQFSTTALFGNYCTVTAAAALAQ